MNTVCQSVHRFAPANMSHQLLGTLSWNLVHTVMVMEFHQEVDICGFEWTMSVILLLGELY